MATFKSRYTTSELLKVIERRSLIHYYWKYNNSEYTFFFVDNRRPLSRASNGILHLCCHKANYYRLCKKIYYLPFRIAFLTKYGKTYSFDLLPDSCFIHDCADFKLKELDERYDGQLVVRVVVI